SPLLKLIIYLSRCIKAVLQKDPSGLPEVCVLFFKCYPSALSVKRLYQELQAFNATAGEKVAFEKIQDC
ncbi:mCG144954, partial [Mus musculus]